MKICFNWFSESKLPTTVALKKAINIASFSNQITQEIQQEFIQIWEIVFGLWKNFKKGTSAFKLCCVVTSVDHKISGSVNPSAFYPA